MRACGPLGCRFWRCGSQSPLVSSSKNRWNARYHWYRCRTHGERYAFVTMPLKSPTSRTYISAWSISPKDALARKNLPLPFVPSLGRYLNALAQLPAPGSTVRNSIWLRRVYASPIRSWLIRSVGEYIAHHGKNLKADIVNKYVKSLVCTTATVGYGLNPWVSRCCHLLPDA